MASLTPAAWCQITITDMPQPQMDIIVIIALRCSISLRFKDFFSCVGVRGGYVIFGESCSSKERERKYSMKNIGFGGVQVILLAVKLCCD